MPSSPSIASASASRMLRGSFLVGLLACSACTSEPNTQLFGDGTGVEASGGDPTGSGGMTSVGAGGAMAPGNGGTVNGGAPPLPTGGTSTGGSALGTGGHVPSGGTSAA